MMITTPQAPIPGHTPGPWGWDSRNGNWYLLTFAQTATHQIVAELKTPLDAIGEADRDLIASAPDLQEALHAIVEHFGDLLQTQSPDLRLRAESALAKSRGEQP